MNLVESHKIAGLARLKREHQKFVKADWRARIFLIRRAVFWCIRRVTVKILSVLVGLPLLGAGRLVRPFVAVGIGMLRYDRLGHLVANTEFWLRRRSLRKDHSREINLLLTGRPANRQVLTMIKRRVTVWESNLLLELYRELKNRRQNSPIWIDLGTTGANLREIWNCAGPQMSFTPDEHRQGERILRSLGIVPGEPFVCFCSRDRAYLETVHNYRTRDQWSYHDYRDCDINNYLPAAEFLATQGLWALRMGAVVEKPIKSSQPRVIDYATKFRSDFADVYLMAHCKFFIGSTAGNLCLSNAFNVPCALANIVPLGYISVSPKDLFIPKKYRHAESRRFLTFREVIGLGADRWLHTEQFTAAGIEAIENTADEILALAIEMDERLKGTWRTTDEDEELQRRFWSLFSPGHMSSNCPARIGADFLRQNRGLLE